MNNEQIKNKVKRLQQSSTYFSNDVAETLELLLAIKIASENSLEVLWGIRADRIWAERKLNEALKALEDA